MSVGAAAQALSASGDDALAQRYEELRAGVISGSVSSSSPSGYAMLVREGMRAWLSSSAARETPATLEPPASPQPLAPEARELCALFADLVLAHTEAHP